MKLSFGTSQLDIDNFNKSYSAEKIQKFHTLLGLALDNGFEFIDTSMYYGNSEQLIGEFIHTTGEFMKVVTKVNGGERGGDIRRCFENSLERLNLAKIETYAIHNFNSFLKNPQAWGELIKLRKEGLVNKIGFSLYYPDEVKYLWESGIDFSYIQIPFNIFDQRFRPLFPELKKNGVEIHTRSTFASGRVFPDSINRGEMATSTGKLYQLVETTGLTIGDICLNYVYLQPEIDYVLVGVEKESDIFENVNSISRIAKVKSLLPILDGLKLVDVDFLLPEISKYQNFTLLNHEKN